MLRLEKIIKFQTYIIAAFIIALIVVSIIVISIAVTAQLNQEKINRLDNVIRGTLEEYKPDRDAQKASRETIKDTNQLVNDTNQKAAANSEYNGDINTTVHEIRDLLIANWNNSSR